MTRLRLICHRRFWVGVNWQETYSRPEFGLGCFLSLVWWARLSGWSRGLKCDVDEPIGTMLLS